MIPLRSKYGPLHTRNYPVQPFTKHGVKGTLRARVRDERKRREGGGIPLRLKKEDVPGVHLSAVKGEPVVVEGRSDLFQQMLDIDFPLLKLVQELQPVDLTVKITIKEGFD